MDEKHQFFSYIHNCGNDNYESVCGHFWDDLDLEFVTFDFVTY